MKLILNNVNIFCEDNQFRQGWIEILDGKFGQISTNCTTSDQSDAEIIDCDGQYALPGFIDIHFHGAMKHDFCDGTEESIQAIADYEASNGVLAICPATMTYTKDRLMPVMQAAAAHQNKTGADLVGINMEGPFISSDKVGAQNPEFVQKPDYEMLKDLDKASGELVKLVDVAPEVDGCQEFIKEASKNYRVSIAHTCATYQDTIEALNNGASHFTHLYNAMPGITHRSPGPIVAGFEFARGKFGKYEKDDKQNKLSTSQNLYAEIITDGHHISDAAIRFAFEMFGSDKMIIISDSCEATGMPDGTYSLGGQDILKKDGVAVLARDTNTIAASASNQFDCFYYAVKHAGITLEDAICACTINPAKAINIDDEYGSITTGKFANLILVDSEFNRNKIFRHGTEI